MCSYVLLIPPGFMLQPSCSHFETIRQIKLFLFFARFFEKMETMRFGQRGIRTLPTKASDIGHAFDIEDHALLLQ